MSMQYLERSENDVEFSGAGGTDGCDPVWALGTKPEFCEEHQVIPTPLLSLHPPM